MSMLFVTSLGFLVLVGVIFLGLHVLLWANVHQPGRDTIEIGAVDFRINVAIDLLADSALAATATATCTSTDAPEISTVSHWLSFHHNALGVLLHSALFMFLGVIALEVSGICRWQIARECRRNRVVIRCEIRGIAR